jgi:hypothetical protein
MKTMYFNYLIIIIIPNIILREISIITDEKSFSIQFLLTFLYLTFNFVIIYLIFISYFQSLYLNLQFLFVLMITKLQHH